VKEVRWEYTREWEFSGWSVEIKHTKWRGGTTTCQERRSLAATLWKENSKGLGDGRIRGCVSSPQCRDEGMNSCQGRGNPKGS
jgi:hypothetical protein